MSITQLSIRTYVRYLVPLTLLSLIAFSPLILLALRMPVPLNAKQAEIVLRYAYVFAGGSVVLLFLLVGGVAPAVRAIDSGKPRSQFAVLAAGLYGLGRSTIPLLLALAAIAIGTLAAVVPGVLLLVLLALTCASDLEGAPARLSESIAIARTKILPIIGVIVLTLAAQAIAIFVLSRPLVPLPKPPRPEYLVAFQHLLRLCVIGIAIAAPLAAVVLAAIHTRGRSQFSAKSNVPEADATLSS